MSGRIRSLGSTFLAAAALAAPAAAAPAPPAIVTGQDAGWPDVRGFDRFGTPAFGQAPWGTWQLAFSPYSTYQKGVRVAVGDVDGDGRAEIVTAPGGSAFTELRVFDGRTFAQETSVLPFRNAVWWNGAFVTTADTDGDGRAEIVDGLDAGCCTTLHVLDAATGADRLGFFPYGNRSEVGARVAAGDVNGDGRDELFAVPVGGRRVSLYGPLGGEAFRSFEPFGAEAGSGVTIATGDVLGDARPELVATAATGAGVEVRVVDIGSGQLLATYRPFGAPAVAPEVAVGDVDGNGREDVVVLARLPDGTRVGAFDAAGARVADFFVLDAGIVPGASLAAGDLDGDGRAEIVLGGGPTTSTWPPVANGPDQRVAVYAPNGSRIGGFAAYAGLFQGGVRVALGDVDGDRQPETITGPGPGMEPEIAVFSQTWEESIDRGTRLAHFLAFEPEFRGGVHVAAGDIDGDGSTEIVVGAGPGRPPEVRVFDRRGRQRLSFLAFEPGHTGGVSVGAGDLDADGRAEIVVGTLSAPARIRTFDGGDPLGPMIVPFPGDDRGVRVAVADPAGTGRGLVLATSAAGDRPIVALIDPFTGAPLRTVELGLARGSSGLYVAAGDLDRDGRDEVVLTPGWGGGATVRVLDGRLVQRRVFVAYPHEGFGTSVATAARLGLPVVAYPRTPRVRVGVRTRMVVARFRDAAGSNVRGLFRATIEWGDGGRSAGVVLARGGGFYDVRGTKQYGRRRVYAVRVRLVDLRGRESIARSTVRVR